MIYFILWEWVFFLVCLCVHHTMSEVKKPEEDIRWAGVAISHHMGTKSTARAARAFNHQTILPDLYLSFVFVYFLVNPFWSLQIKPLISFWQKTQNINKKIFYLERLLKDPLPFSQGLLLLCFRRRPFASITF